MSDLPEVTPSCIVDGVLVLNCDVPLSADMAIQVRKNAEQIWPNRKIAVLEKGLRLGTNVSEEVLLALLSAVEDLTQAVRDNTEILLAEDEDSAPSTYMDGTPVQ